MPTALLLYLYAVEIDDRPLARALLRAMRRDRARADRTSKAIAGTLRVRDH